MPILLSDVIKNQGDFKILTFEDTGVIARKLAPVWKGWNNFLKVKSGGFPRSYTMVEIKEINLKLYKEFCYEFKKWSPTPEEEEKAREYYNLAREVLDTVPEITYWYTDDRIYIRTAPDVAMSSFATSDNPAVWRKLQQKYEDYKKIEKVKQALDKGGN